MFKSSNKAPERFATLAACFVLVISGCASQKMAVKNDRVIPQEPIVIDPFLHASSPPVVIMLQQEKVGWSIYDGLSPTDKPIERVGYDPATKKFSLDTGCKGEKKDFEKPREKGCLCFRGLVNDPVGKGSVVAGLCGSLFSKDETGGFAVISTILAPISIATEGGKVATLRALDFPQMSAAIDSVGGVNYAELLFINKAEAESSKLKTLDDVNAFTRKYSSYSNDRIELGGLIRRVVAAAEPLREEKRVKEAFELYRRQFSEITTLAAANTFISRYSSNDPDKLVPKAVQQRDAFASKLRDSDERARVALAELKSWRKTLKVGSETFCGSVVEARAPMYKIAINTPLQGYASEVWLNEDKIFLPEAGCRNSNGRLSPY